MRKTLVIGIVMVIVITGASAVVYAMQQPQSRVQVLVFTQDNCKNCDLEKIFLRTLNKDVEVAYYDLGNPIVEELFKQVIKKAQIDTIVPLTLIGRTFVLGYENDNITGSRIKALIENSRNESQVFERFEDYIASSEVGVIDSGSSTQVSVQPIHQTKPKEPALAQPMNELFYIILACIIALLVILVRRVLKRR